LYRDILGHLREQAYLDQRRGFHNSHIAQYHAGMASKDLDYILQEFSKPDSVIRLVICTIAFGMGINISDIELVIHWGACDSLMDYWQEVGRAGRDGRRAKALYHVTPGSLLQASDDMKELCRLMDKCEIKCFRESILKHFIGYTSSTGVPECLMKCAECECPRCRCCHLCLITCPCHNLL
jgi:superfamily II DNA helicase RecQ